MPENSRTRLRKTICRPLRPYRYLLIANRDRERVHLVRERVKCDKPSCRCADGLRHGPYTFLRYQYWDAAAKRDRYARSTCPESELPECGVGFAVRALRRRLGGVKRGC